jgi:hypothetical protein
MAFSFPLNRTTVFSIRAEEKSTQLIGALTRILTSACGNVPTAISVATYDNETGLAVITVTPAQ